MDRRRHGKRQERMAEFDSTGMRDKKRRKSKRRGESESTYLPISQPSTSSHPGTRSVQTWLLL
jgi:hypothetical protein